MLIAMATSIDEFGHLHVGHWHGANDAHEKEKRLEIKMLQRLKQKELSEAKNLAFCICLMIGIVCQSALLIRSTSTLCCVCLDRVDGVDLRSLCLMKAAWVAAESSNEKHPAVVAAQHKDMMKMFLALHMFKFYCDHDCCFLGSLLDRSSLLSSRNRD